LTDRTGEWSRPGVEGDHELAQLVLLVLDLTRDLGAFFEESA
jgi:hypothetical protein